MTVAKAIKNAAIGNNLRIVPDGDTTVPTFVGLGGSVIGVVDMDTNLRNIPDGGTPLPTFGKGAGTGGVVGVGGTFTLFPVEPMLHILCNL